MKKMKINLKDLLQTAKQTQNHLRRSISDLFTARKKCKRLNADVKNKSQLTLVRCEKNTKSLSKGSKVVLPSPQALKNRRNAICEEIEKLIVTGPRENTLRQDRFNMLQVIALKSIGFMQNFIQQRISLLFSWKSMFYKFKNLTPWHKHEHKAYVPL